MGEWKQVAKGTMQTQWVKKIGKLINVPHLHNHDFRHSNATLLRNQGMSLEEISEDLNPASTAVTLAQYTKKDRLCVRCWGGIMESIVKCFDIEASAEIRLDASETNLACLLNLFTVKNATIQFELENGETIIVDINDFSLKNID